MTDHDLEWGEDVEALSADVARPVTRGDCARGPRPCPFISCRAHMFVDSVSADGHLRSQFGSIDEMKSTCSLDLADEGTRTLEEVGAILGVTRERVRQIEKDGLEKMANELDAGMLVGWTHVADGLHEETLADIVDDEFKAGVQRAYERIVPENQRGSKAIRVGKRGRP